MRDFSEERREVLVVDDSDADIALFEQLLAKKNPNAVVHPATSSDEVDDLILKGDRSESDIDLVIIDLNMPKEGGLAVLRKLKSDENLRKIPVIVFTGSESELDVKQAYELGANSYLVKPVAFEELSKVIGFIDSYWLRGVSQLPSRRSEDPDSRA